MSAGNTTNTGTLSMTGGFLQYTGEKLESDNNDELVSTLLDFAAEKRIESVTAIKCGKMRFYTDSIIFHVESKYPATNDAECFSDANHKS